MHTDSILRCTYEWYITQEMAVWRPSRGMCAGPPRLDAQRHVRSGSTPFTPLGNPLVDDTH